MGIIAVSWGVVMTLTGIVQNYGGLIAARVALGIAEFVLYTSCPLHIHIELITFWPQGWLLPRRRIHHLAMVSSK